MLHELLYRAYQPDKVIEKDRKESPPPPSHTKMTQTQNIQHHMGAGPWVASLENWGGGLKSLLRASQLTSVVVGEHN